MERWVNRVALVTGASAGIGAAICKELVKQGMIVIGCARNYPRLKSMAKEKEMQGPGKFHPMECDMSEEGDILKMYTKIRVKFGRLDVCINNAITNIDSSLLTGDIYDWKYLLKVGILGLCINTREAIQLMQESNVDDGQIIHMGSNGVSVFLLYILIIWIISFFILSNSVIGHKLPSFQKPPDNTPTPWFHIYNSMKTMLRTLAEGLRQELKDCDSKIKVALVSPGATETEIFTRSMGEEIAKAFYGYYKCLKAQDVAEAVTLILQAPPHENVNDVILEPLAFMIQC